MLIRTADLNLLQKIHGEKVIELALLNDIQSEMLLLLLLYQIMNTIFTEHTINNRQ